MDPRMARALDGAVIHDLEGNPLWEKDIEEGVYVFKIEHAYYDDSNQLHVFVSWREPSEAEGEG
jgi:hypothetical protein